MTKDATHPLNGDQLQVLSDLTNSFTGEQLLWSSGYLAGYYAAKNPDNSLASGSIQITAPVPIDKNITFLYGSRTGNGEGLAKELGRKATAAGFTVKLKDMEDYKSADLKTESNVLIIVSTHGDGEPPLPAKEFYEFIHSKRAPKLDHINFAVLALGDSSYIQFCQAGIDFDNRFAELGAKRIIDRVDCDVEYEEPGELWLDAVLEKLNNPTPTSAPSPNNGNTLTQSGDTNKPTYTKSNPYDAAVLDKTFLHGRSSDRQTLHVEFSIENSGINYEPGDSLGVIATNSTELVEHVLEATALNASDIVDTPKGSTQLQDALINNFELTQLTPDVLNRFASLTNNNEINKILNNTDAVREFVHGKDIVDLFSMYPEKLSANDFTSLLRPIQPRLYSISSSQLAYPDEVHLTVGVVKYNQNNRDKSGLCSVFLSERVEENEHAPIFVETNKNFRLPANPETPIIMIGAGTGIAPYRSFVQHREQFDNRGKSWLFFGNRHSESEFLYQLEWQRHLKQGTLSRMDVAFSRDTKEAIYVQHRIEQQGKELYQWLEDGAHLYICGDMRKMARSVHASLVNIVSLYGGKSPEAAEAYLSELQKIGRYQTDVY